MKLDKLDISFSQETADFKTFRVDFDFNGEMLLDNVHFISEASGYSLEHVSDVSGYCVENSSLFVSGHVSADFEKSDGLFSVGVNVFSFIDFNFQVSEILSYGSSLSFYGDDSGFYRCLD